MSKPDPMREIVAFLVGDRWLVDYHIQGALPISRAHMQFMAACDLGPVWEKLASGRTLGVMR